MCFRALQLYQLHDVESVFTHNQFLFENNLRLNFAVAAYVGLELQNMLVCAQENKQWGQDLVKGTINDGVMIFVQPLCDSFFTILSLIFTIYFYSLSSFFSFYCFEPIKRYKMKVVTYGCTYITTHFE